MSQSDVVSISHNVPLALFVSVNLGYAKMYPNGISQPGTNDGKATPMPTLTTVNSTGAIFVNKDGNRFIDETVAFAEIKDAATQQPLNSNKQAQLNSKASPVMGEAFFTMHIIRIYENTTRDTLIAAALHPYF